MNISSVGGEGPHPFSLIRWNVCGVCINFFQVNFFFSETSTLIHCGAFLARAEKGSKMLNELSVEKNWDCIPSQNLTPESSE